MHFVIILPDGFTFLTLEISKTIQFFINALDLINNKAGNVSKNVYKSFKKINSANDKDCK